MNEGDVVLTVLPQADGRLKNRPAAALRKMPPLDDWLVWVLRPSSTMRLRALTIRFAPDTTITPRAD